MQNSQTLKNASLPIFKYIFFIQAVFFILLFKQPSLGLAFFFIIGITILLVVYPEFSLAISLTGSVFLHILYDYFGLSIPYFPLISHTLIILAGAIIYLEKSCVHKEIKLGRLFYLSVIIAAILIIGLVYSSNKSYGLNKTLLYILTNIPLFIIASCYTNDSKSIENILFFTILIGILLTILSFIAAQNSVFFKIYRFRLSENIGPLGVARPLTFASISLFYFIVNKKLVYKIFSIILFPPLIMPVIWSGSRGPLLGICLALFTFIILQPKIRVWQKLVMIVFFLGVAFFYFTHSANQVSERIATPLAEEASAAFRLLAFSQAITQFLASPLTGIGTGSFFLETGWVPLTYPHNLILELACENGILGLISILIFLVLTIRYGFIAIKKFSDANNFKYLQLSIIMSALFINALWNAMVSGHISSNAYVWLTAGFIWALSLSNQSETTDGNGA